MGGRSYLTIRALVLIVTCLVVLQYISLLQSAENADSRRGPPVFFILDDEEHNHNYRRHVLQTLHAGQYRHITLEGSKGIKGSSTPTNNNGTAEEELRTENVINNDKSSQDHDNLEVKSLQNNSSFSPSSNISENELSECPMIPPNLHGRFAVETKNIPPMKELEGKIGNLDLGGRFRPMECKARHRVAIIVPYRDREEHLRIFLYNIHRFLQRQQIDYGIYIVEQVGTGAFNRAMLMNVGAAEALKQHNYQCFIFHDVDLLPEDDRNLYTCPVQPRHMSVAIDNFLYHLPYDDIFGGVSALTVEQFRLVNGFSNMFWGWGGEDDDMANRLRIKKLHISRYPANIARYKMMKHGKEKANPERFKYLYSGAKRISKDGYNSLKYRKADFLLKRLYTWILVDLPRLKL